MGEMKMEDNDWKTIGEIISHKLKTKILFLISSKIHTPSEISRNLNVSLSHVSNQIRYLREKMIIECKNPSAKKGRLYAITEYGKEVIKIISKLKESEF